MQKLLVAGKLFWRLDSAVRVTFASHNGVLHVNCKVPFQLHNLLLVFSKAAAGNFDSKNAEWLATDCSSVTRDTVSLAASICACRAAPFLFLIVRITERHNRTYLCRWQGSVRVYSTIDPVSVQMNGSLGLSVAAHDLKPFQVSEVKTDHSLCHVGIPNPGQLLHWLKAVRCTLRMFCPARAKFKENEP